MKKRTTYITSFTILALTALAGTAIAQSQAEPVGESVRLAKHSSEMSTSLSRAISIAEKHSKGVVIGIRLTAKQDAFRTGANGLEDRSRDSARGKSDPKSTAEGRDPNNQRDRGDDRDTPDRESKGNDGDKTNQMSESQRKRQSELADRTNMRDARGVDASLFAIATCVIDRTRVREVVVNMADGSVVGMQSASAWGRTELRGGAQQGITESLRMSLVRASDLLNATAHNAQDERVGDIDELVLDADTNHMLYAVLRRGGFLGINEARYALPASQVSAPSQGEILVNLNSTDFENRSGFDDDKWPTRGDQELSKGTAGDARQMPQATRIIKATELIGTEVQSSDAQAIGKIVDLIVQPSTGQVVYAIVECDHGDIVVPMAVVEVMGKGRVIKMTQSDIREVPALGTNTEPDWNDIQWNRATHKAFNAEMTLSSSSANPNRR